MTRDLLIGLDSGTSVVKAVAFDLAGTQRGLASLPNATAIVDGAGVEQDLSRTWDDAARVLRMLADAVPDLARRTAAIAVTGQGDGTWLIDAEGQPTAPALLWHDGRSGRIVQQLHRDGIAAQVQAITGTAMNMSNQTSQLLWLKRHRPEAVARATTAFHCKDWIHFRLTGLRATDLAEGTFTYGDYRTRTYDLSILDLLGLRELEHFLPPMIDGTRHSTPLTADGAAATGLLEGTPVVLAPVDLLCTALGAGLFESGRNIAFSVLGSTGAHLRLVFGAENVRLGDRVGYTMPFVTRDSYVSMVSNMAATLNIDWLVGLIEQGLRLASAEPPPRRELIARLDRAAGAASPGRVLYHPFIAEAGERGPFVEPAARAAILGLSSSVALPDLMRGVYESLGFATRDCYEATGPMPEEIRVAGGAARSAVCRGIVAAATGAPVRLVQREEAGAAGAAMVAALAIGVFASATDACAAWVAPLLGPPEPPDSALVEAYRPLFPLYRDAYRRLVPIWHGLAALRETA